MRVVCIYKDNAEYSREVEDWIGDFERRTGKEIEKINPDRIDGDSFARVYDVVEYPTVMALDDDGRMLDEWKGLPLPRMDEVSYYAAEKLKI